MADCTRRLGRTDEAVRYYRRATEVENECDAAWSQLAICLHATGNWNETRAGARRAVELEPEDDTHRALLWDVEQALVHRDEARSAEQW